MVSGDRRLNPAPGQRARRAVAKRLTPRGAAVIEDSGRPDSNRRRTAWKAVTLPLSYARGGSSIRRGVGTGERVGLLAEGAAGGAFEAEAVS